MRLKFLLPGIVLALSCGPAGAASGPDGAEWLMKINDAAKQLDYTGTFVYVQGDRIESMRVTHQSNGDTMRQRIYALNGAPREVIRDAKQVWCYVPDKKLGVHEYRQVSEQGFPNLLPQGLDHLVQYYEVKVGETGRIADREAQQILVVPRDEYRYGYDLWADKESGLLLRAALLDGESRPIEQYLFTNIDIGAEIAPAELESNTPKSDLVWYGDAQSKFVGDKPAGEMPAGSWVADDLPDGFMLTRKIRRLSPMRTKMLEHYVYSDGLATVSVFVEEVQGDAGARLDGHNKMGAAHVFGRELNGHHVTVVGEVPSQTVDLIGKSVRPKAE